MKTNKLSVNQSNQRSVCPVACTLDLIGDKWTLLVVRDLYAGSRFFKDFMAAPEKISTNILADRLNRLVAAGWVQTSPDESTKGRKTYSLTEQGEKLVPLLTMIRDWGLKNIEGTTAMIGENA